MCHFYIRYPEFTQAQVKTLIEVFTPVQKQYKTAESCGTQQKDLLTVYLWCHYIVRYLGVERAPYLL